MSRRFKRGGLPAFVPGALPVRVLQMQQSRCQLPRGTSEMSQRTNAFLNVNIHHDHLEHTSRVKFS